MPAGQWKQIEDMHRPRFDFTPCELRDSVPLIGGHNTTGEVFNPISGQFETLPIELLQNGATITFAFNEELITLTADTISH